MRKEKYSIYNRTLLSAFACLCLALTGCPSTSTYPPVLLPDPVEKDLVGPNTPVEVTISVLSNDSPGKYQTNYSEAYGTSIQPAFNENSWNHIEVATQPSVGQASVSGEAILYKNPGIAGTFSFRYQAFTQFDSIGLTNNVSAGYETVTVVVKDPTANATANYDEFTQSSIDSSFPLDVLHNDDNVAPSTVITATTQPTNGSVSISSDRKSLIFNQSATGTGNFTYTLTGGSTADVKVTTYLWQATIISNNSKVYGVIFKANARVVASLKSDSQSPVVYIQTDGVSTMYTAEPSSIISGSPLRLDNVISGRGLVRIFFDELHSPPLYSVSGPN